jgi:hypothetical protein
MDFLICFGAGLMVIGIILVFALLVVGLIVLTEHNRPLGTTVAILAFLALFTWLGCNIAYEEGWVDTCHFCIVDQR